MEWFFSTISLGVLSRYIYIAGKLNEGTIYKIKYSTLFFIGIISIALMGIMAFNSNILKLFNDIPALIGYLFLALLASDIKFIKQAFLKLSKISYELYLIHILLFELVFYCMKPNTLLSQLLVGVFSLGIAVLLSIGFRACIKIIKL